jgi:hypothetical protein
VNYIVYDREGNPTSNPFSVWNTTGRMYAEVVDTPYQEGGVPVPLDAGGNIDLAAAAGGPLESSTWNHVWYASNWTQGDVVRWYYANPLQLGADTFTFTPGAASYNADQAKNDVKEINVFPNPYYGVNPEELNKYNRFVTFNHLPNAAKIRIFNLAGQLVRTIDKNTTDQFQRWDLLNGAGLPVASGLYIVYIDMPDLGTTKTLKVAIIQEEQVLDRF